MILAKLPVFTSSKGIDNYQILLFFKSGKRVNTGMLYCKSNEFETINIRFKFRQISRKKEIKSEFTQDTTSRITISRNIAFPFLVYLPLIISVVTLWLLNSGFNTNYGIQSDFAINGIVIEKSFDKDNATLVVIDNKSNKTYKIDVRKNIVDRFEERQKITIRGKRGSMGLLYNIHYSYG